MEWNWHTPLSFSALSYHKGWEDRNIAAGANTSDDSSTADKNLVNFGPVRSEFCTIVCAGQATCTLVSSAHFYVQFQNVILYRCTGRWEGTAAYRCESDKCCMIMAVVRSCRWRCRDVSILTSMVLRIVTED